MFFRLIALLLMLCLPCAAMLHAQDCYQKALEKGEHFARMAKPDKARLAWEKGKKCPGADIAKLDEKIRSLTDNDLDGIPNDYDECRFEYGAKEFKGCPCAAISYSKGIDAYYDNQPDSALVLFATAKTCSDTKMAEIAAWETKIAEKKYAYEPAEKAAIIAAPDKLPEFPGGEMEMFRHLYTRILYPMKAVENGVQGTVYLKFVVETDGQLSHLQIVEEPGADTGKEALRVVKTFPRFNPATVKGEPVRCYFKLPVKYKLE
ncbi:MAG: energy transducer TonB [Bacteroidetes bacterium]|nr:energy transducer TonB [Bacteroidota bacterium]